MTFDQVVQNLALGFIAWEFIKVIFIPKIIWKNVMVSLHMQEAKKRAKEQKTRAPFLTESRTTKFGEEKNKRNFLQQKNPILQFIGYIYLIFAILLFFTPWWWVSLLMIALSTASMYTIKPMMGRRESFTFKVWFILFMDGLITVLLLSIIINPLNLLK